MGNYDAKRKKTELSKMYTKSTTTAEIIGIQNGRYTYVQTVNVQLHFNQAIKFDGHIAKHNLNVTFTTSKQSL